MERLHDDLTNRPKEVGASGAMLQPRYGYGRPNDPRLTDAMIGDLSLHDVLAEYQRLCEEHETLARTLKQVGLSELVQPHP